MKFEHEQPGEEIGPELGVEEAEAQEVANIDTRSAEAVIEDFEKEGWHYVGPAETGTDVYSAVNHGKEVRFMTVKDQRLVFERDEEPEV